MSFSSRPRVGGLSQTSFVEPASSHLKRSSRALSDFKHQLVVPGVLNSHPSTMCLIVPKKDREMDEYGHQRRRVRNHERVVKVKPTPPEHSDHEEVHWSPAISKWVCGKNMDSPDQWLDSDWKKWEDLPSHLVSAYRKFAPSILIIVLIFKGRNL